MVKITNSKYYLKRIRKISKILTAFSGVSTVIALNLVPANSKLSPFSMESFIKLEPSRNSSVSIGSNNYFPLRYSVEINESNIENEYEIQNGETLFDIKKDSQGYFVDGYLNLDSATSIQGIQGNYAQPLPIIINQNLAIQLIITSTLFYLYLQI